MEIREMSFRKVVNIIKGFWYKFTNQNNRLQLWRMQICNKCNDRDGKWCGLCGCLLDAKTRVADEHCLKNLW